MLIQSTSISARENTRNIERHHSSPSALSTMQEFPSPISFTPKLFFSELLNFLHHLPYNTNVKTTKLFLFLALLLATLFLVFKSIQYIVILLRSTMAFLRRQGSRSIRSSGKPSRSFSNRKRPSATTTTPHLPDHHHRRSRVFTSRVLFLACLAGVAASLGFAAHRLLTDTEKRLASEQFEAISESALAKAVNIANRQKLGLITLASIVEQSAPDADEWPLVHVNGFKVVSQNVVKTSSGMSMGFMPIVKPEQKQDFEDYAYNTVMKGQALTDTMYGLDEKKQKYNETDGSTYWNSPHKIFTPFYQHSTSDIYFLLNWHSIEARGRLVDEMIACSELRAQEMIAHYYENENEDSAASDDFVPRECSILTDVIDLSFRSDVEIPAAVSVHPIYPANNATVMTGLITSAIQWNDTLLDVFSSEVRGVDCVLQTDSRVYTYEITYGKVSLK